MLLYLISGVFGVTLICSAFVLDHSPPPFRPPFNPSPSPLNPSPSTNYPTPPTNFVMAMMLCMLSGIAHAMCCCFWAFTLVSTQACRKEPQKCYDFCTRSDLDPDTNYTSVSCFFWTVVIFFVVVAGSLLVDVFDRYNGYQKCASLDLFCLEFWLVWLMVAPLMLFVCVCCCRFCVRLVYGY